MFVLGGGFMAVMSGMRVKKFSERFSTENLGFFEVTMYFGSDTQCSAFMRVNDIVTLGTHSGIKQIEVAKSLEGIFLKFCKIENIKVLVDLLITKKTICFIDF